MFEHWFNNVGSRQTQPRSVKFSRISNNEKHIEHANLILRQISRWFVCLKFVCSPLPMISVRENFDAGSVETFDRERISFRINWIISWAKCLFHAWNKTQMLDNRYLLESLDIIIDNRQIYFFILHRLIFFRFQRVLRKFVSALLLIFVN